MITTRWSANEWADFAFVPRHRTHLGAEMIKERSRTPKVAALPGSTRRADPGRCAPDPAQGCSISCPRGSDREATT